jgi:CPA1 family monovalent cation:H+ antiporter
MTWFLLAAEESDLIKQEVAAVILLAIAAGVALIARRLSFPFTVALVVAGFLAAGLGEIVAVTASPELILSLLVPPLLFEATLHLPWRKLKVDAFPVLLTAIVGTGFGTLVIGGVVHEVLDLSWPASFAFGALISATDPVAVIAFFKSLGTPKRLSILVEGESLFNDAVAVVAFGLAIEVAKGEEFSAGSALMDFLIVSAGGLAVGLILGYVVSEIVLAQVDDALIETSTTLALAYGSFLMAEEFGLIIGQDDLHFSGILAVVAAGLMVGNLGFKNTSPTTRLTLENFWQLLTFLVNSMVFLLIGLSTTFSTLADELPAVLLGVVLVLAVRLIVTYGLSYTIGIVHPSRKIPRKYQHVMYWGGLRGAISLALALTITDEIFDSATVEKLQAMTFGVVLFTLLIQGTTITGLIKRLGLAGREDGEIAQQTHQARIHMARAGQSEVAKLGADGVVVDTMAQALSKTYGRDITEFSSQLSAHLNTNAELEVAMLLQARRDALFAEKSALTDIVRTGLVDSQVAEHLSIELNNRMAALDLIEERWESNPTPHFGREGERS